ncbi:hypothetical protein PM082_014540 [Marasmius tenuissimus]|nr:hypothetical protein PM082_014540 [Marasmius tenuissimus]
MALLRCLRRAPPLSTPSEPLFVLFPYPTATSTQARRLLHPQLRIVVRWSTLSTPTYDNDKRPDGDEDGVTRWYRGQLDSRRTRTQWKILASSIQGECAFAAHCVSICVNGRRSSSTTSFDVSAGILTRYKLTAAGSTTASSHASLDLNPISTTHILLNFDHHGPE